MLIGEDELRSACEEALEHYRERDTYRDWAKRLSDFLREVAEIDDKTFLSEPFQRRLWDDNPVSATGMGSVDVSSVITDPTVANCLLEIRGREEWSDAKKAEEGIRDCYEEIVELIHPSVERIPRLKIWRILASFFPEHMTTVTHGSKLKQLARAMGIGKTTDHPGVLHPRIRERLRQVLGPSGAGNEPLEHMKMPWLLFARFVDEKGEDATETAGVVAGDETLKPLPADRRRRGMNTIKGYLPTLRTFLEFVRDGCKREDLKEHIRSVNPALSDGSIGLHMNALIGEWGAIRAEGDEFRLTPRGEAFLESGDPAELADWLLTRMLAFDTALYELRESGPKPLKELIARLKAVNPGWTTEFAPTTLTAWQRNMGLLELGPDRMISLTDEGKVWADRIHWVPEDLPAPPDSAHDAESSDDAAGQSPRSSREIPDLKEIVEIVGRAGTFPRPLISRMHAGLWSRERRHFAVLTGLSGAGKTLLARAYGRALAEDPSAPGNNMITIPVQPGWYDPAALLGYVNPLDKDSYIRTPFLDFLLSASLDHEQPHTVILDEMNLSHPEQYMAPLLSAMETGANIVLHSQGDDVDGVPPVLPYPSNLVILGTVNMDETTHGLSDKVLDRAFVVEFWDVDIAAFPRWEEYSLSDDVIARTRSLLIELAAALRPVRMHFGWRVVEDVLGFLRASGSEQELPESLDAVVYSKVLPKLRGDDTPRFRDALTAASAVLAKEGLHDSEQKLAGLIDDLEQTGSARFWR